nr:MAG TPA: protein of unknown function (DUF4350) [Caudoviricetes sp.]
MVVVMGERDFCAAQIEQIKKWVKTHSKSQ